MIKWIWFFFQSNEVQSESLKSKTNAVKNPQGGGGFGGMKKGFLFGGSGPTKTKQTSNSKPQNSTASVSKTEISKDKEEIPYIKPHGKTESGLTFDEVQTAMSETKGLLDNQGMWK